MEALRGKQGWLAGLGLLVLISCQGPVAEVSSGGIDPIGGSLENGRALFWAGGCASCHAAAGKVSLDAPALGGGEPLKSGYGLFRGPNISPDPNDGIGAWSLETFDRAMRQGISPEGRAYYPAFPYDSFARMKRADIADLHAYLRSLPPVAGGVTDSEPVFPVNMPVAVESWRRLYLRPEPVVELSSAGSEVQRGQYLVEGPGHCGTCHTPRTPLGGPRLGRWLGGAELLDNSGAAPNLTPHEDGLAGYSIEEITEALHPTGGGERYAGMAAARFDLSLLPESDRRAIAAYLRAIPPVASAP